MRFKFYHPLFSLQDMNTLLNFHGLYSENLWEHALHISTQHLELSSNTVLPDSAVSMGAEVSIWKMFRVNNLDKRRTFTQQSRVRTFPEAKSQH